MSWWGVGGWWVFLRIVGDRLKGVVGQEGLAWCKIRFRFLAGPRNDISLA